MSSNQPAVPTDPAEIERAIQRHRNHLASTVDELTTRLQPRNLLSQAVSDLQSTAQGLLGTSGGTHRPQSAGASAVGGLRALVTREDGSVYTERVAGAAAAVAAGVLVVGWLASRSRGE
ncbi:MAG: hypothetical protein CSA58_06105 [Micrococcales bacterium]|nr:MAG: hypothetical protein CSB46_08835 [Micrococcales bacterium]PIE27083.1 MAG: hypothetical protein CSA58_06105 [Micrococcales bacterium]